jgi:SAM-dependent methyltransferase
MTQPNDITWLPETAAGTVLTCPMCGDSSAHVAELTVPHQSQPGRLLTMLRCGVCKGLIMTPPGATPISELGTTPERFARQYVEVGAGIWEMCWPPAMVSDAAARSLLDIGCGYGFTVDLWRRCMNADAVGCDTASYAALGRKALGAEIHQSMLQDIESLRGKRFGLVYASEVIEHVPEPRDFVRLLADRLTADGVLVLTTPNAGFVHRDEEPVTVLAALAPGFHGFLFSSAGLARLGRGCGFAHVEVREYRERLVAWMSAVPIRLDEDRGRLRAPYLAYLRQRYASSSHDSDLHAGIGYRLFKELVLADALVEAAELRPAFVSILRERMGDEPTPDFILSALPRDASMERLGTTLPWFLAQACHLLGICASRLDSDAPSALAWSRAAVAVARAFARASAAHNVEAIAFGWAAQRRCVQLLIEAGDVAGASRSARALLEAARAPAADFGYARAPRSLACDTAAELLVVLLNGRRFDEVEELAATLATLPDDPGERHHGGALCECYRGMVALQRDQQRDEARACFERARLACDGASSERAKMIVAWADTQLAALRQPAVRWSSGTYVLPQGGR